ncbi:MAG: hypothetical protein SXG53_02295 [Pseudomonadota bacterium]|nr:hypothetical protein [Pseudomonadota bacterium]
MARHIGGFTHTLLSLSVLAVLTGCGGPPVTQNPLPAGSSGPPAGGNPINPGNPGTGSPGTPNPPASSIGRPATATANDAVLTATRTTVHNLNAAIGSAGWQPTALLETNNSDPASSPRVAFDRSGNGFVVWTQGSDMIARRYTAATAAWGNPVVLDNSIAPAHQARVSVDRLSGNAIAIWTQSDGAAESLYASRFNTLTNTWSAAELLETRNDAVNIAEDNSSVAVSGGHAAISWVQSAGPGPGAIQDIYLSRLVSGSWTAPLLVESSNENGQQPKVAVDASGNVTIAWRQFDAVTGFRINTRRWNDTAQAFGPVLAMNDHGDRRPQLQFDAAGNGFLLWRGGPFARRFDATTGQWGAEVELRNAGATPDGGDISVDEHGNALAVWVEIDAGATYIYARRYDAAAGSWGNAELLETTSGTLQPTVSVSGGDAVVSWLRANAANANRNDVYSIKQTNGSWGAVRLLETLTGSGSELSSTIDAAGNAAVVWAQSDSSNVSIFAARFLSQSIVVSAGDTWQSIANLLYGVNAIEAGSALQAALGGIALSDGMILTGFPTTLSVTTNIPAYYTVLATDTWSHIAKTVYGVTDVAAIDRLRAALGNPTLSAGLQLVVPGSFQYTTSANFSAPLNWNRVNTTATTYHPLERSLLTVPLTDWSAAQQLESSNQPANNPRVAFDAQGNGIAVWAQASDVIARRYIDGTGWSAPTVLDANTNTAFSPRVAIDRASGDAVVSWVQNDGVAPSMYVSSFDASSNAWSVAMVLETSNNAVNTNGETTSSMTAEHAAVTWLQSDGTADRVYLSRLVAGTWTAPSRIDTDAAFCMQPQVAIDGSGNATIAWRQQDAFGAFRINTRRWDNTGLALGAVMAMNGDGDRQPRLGLDAQGNGILLWRGNGVQVRHFDVASGQWGPQLGLHTQTVAGNGELSVNAAGDALASWTETVGGVNAIYARHYDAAAGTWGAATVLANNMNASFMSASLVGKSGVVGWLTTGSGNADVYAARLQDGVWGAATLLETQAPAATEITSHVDANDNATLLWVQNDAVAPSIYQARSNSTAYYLVPAGATWQSLANTLYGIDTAAAAEALQAALANPALTAGLHLQAPPATLVVTPPVPTYYIVQSGDTWQSITLALYGTIRSQASAALWNRLGRPALIVGQSLVIPSELTYTIDE